MAKLFTLKEAVNLILKTFKDKKSLKIKIKQLQDRCGHISKRHYFNCLKQHVSASLKMKGKVRKMRKSLHLLVKHLLAHRWSYILK